MSGFNVDKGKIIAHDFEDKYPLRTHLHKEYIKQKRKNRKADKCQIEIPGERLEEVQQILDNYFYKLVVEDTPGEHCVVLDNEVDSSEILRNSVLRKQNRRRDIFVMKDEILAHQIVEYGATLIQEAEISMEAIEWKTD